MNTNKTLFTIIISMIGIQFLFADPPGWTYNPADYASTATLGAAGVSMDGANISDLDDILAAFDENDNCRGIAGNLTAEFGPLDGLPYHEMQIGSNAAGDIITFKYYDAATDAILIVGSWSFTDPAYPYVFEVDDLIGNTNDPVMMDAGPPLEGCTDPGAENYNADANISGCCDYVCADDGLGGGLPMDCASALGMAPTMCQDGLWAYSAEVVQAACPITCNACPEPCPVIIVGCMDATACDYNADATDSGSCNEIPTACDTCSNDLNDGTGTVVTDGGLDGNCDTCESDTIVDNDADDDDICDADETSGCLDDTACDYNAAATDSGSCNEIPTACDTCSNDLNDGTGTVVTDGGLDGNCDTCESDTIVDNDADDDDICDADETSGCMDSAACNYNASASDDDGSCLYLDGICESCDSGVVTDNDTDDDGVCDADEMIGCMDGTACNFDATATDNDTSLCHYDDECGVCNGPGPQHPCPGWVEGDDLVCGTANCSDSDQDGVPDTDDSHPQDDAQCADTDEDSCDDCSQGGVGSYDPTNDGHDFDGDGLCDAGDPDDDNDGIDDTTDADDDDDGVCDGATESTTPANDLCVAGPDTDTENNNFICGDFDNDGCEDCSSGTFDQAGPGGTDGGGDGLDFDGDGLCDIGDDDTGGDTDDDNDGVCDGSTADTTTGFECIAGPDSDPFNYFVCSTGGDASGDDGCEDCLWGGYDPTNDGDDYDSDSLCDAGDPDDDNDGYNDDVDVDPQTGDDCSQGMIGVGTDYDHDGCQDAEDNDDDGDGVLEDGTDIYPNSSPATYPAYLCAGANAGAGNTCTADDIDGDGGLSDDPVANWSPDSDNIWYCSSGNCEDDDDDNDGVFDGADIDSQNNLSCSDNDGDECDDCSAGLGVDAANDGTDSDGDGLCDTGDSEPNCSTNNTDACGVCGGDGFTQDANSNSITCEGVPGDFTYNLSSSQAFYYINNINDLNGNALTAEDWVGVFNGATCVGSRLLDPSLCSGGICDVPAMGDDGFAWTSTTGYLNVGDEPSFQIYDASESAYFDVTPSENYGFSIYGIFEISELMITMDYSINLYEYMNLISFYGLPEDNSVSVVMADLGSNIALVAGEGAATTYDGLGWEGSLTQLDISSGYWLRMSDLDTLAGSGFPYNESREYDLNIGANLVSFPASGSFDIAGALPDDIEGNIQAIMAEGTSAINTTQGWLGSLFAFDGLRGYWIFTDAAISFSYELDNMLARAATPSQMTEKPAGLEFIQSSQQAFYYMDESSIRELNAVNGDWFVSFCGDIVAGAREYLGETIDIPVMGYDGHYSTAGYCESGDTPQFRLFKSATSEMIDLYSETPAWGSNGIFFVDNVSQTDLIPTDFSMLSAYPNPFNPVTSIGFEIPEESMVQISIFDLKGQEVTTLVNELTSPGMYSISWNADNAASGVYFVHFTASGDGFTPITQIQKLMLIK